MRQTPHDQLIAPDLPSSHHGDHRSKGDEPDAEGVRGQRQPGQGLRRRAGQERGPSAASQRFAACGSSGNRLAPVPDVVRPARPRARFPNSVSRPVECGLCGRAFHTRGGIPGNRGAWQHARIERIAPVAEVIAIALRSAIWQSWARTINRGWAPSPRVRTFIRSSAAAMPLGSFTATRRYFAPCWSASGPARLRRAQVSAAEAGTADSAPDDPVFSRRQSWQSTALQMSGALIPWQSVTRVSGTIVLIRGICGPGKWH